MLYMLREDLGRLNGYFLKTSCGSVASAVFYLYENFILKLLCMLTIFTNLIISRNLEETILVQSDVFGVLVESAFKSTKLFSDHFVFMASRMDFGSPLAYFPVRRNC